MKSERGASLAAQSTTARRYFIEALDECCGADGTCDATTINQNGALGADGGRTRIGVKSDRGASVAAQALEMQILIASDLQQSTTARRHFIEGYYNDIDDDYYLGRVIIKLTLPRLVFI